MPDLFSKSELLERGWTERQLGLALDEPDEYGPSTHWFNKYGEPFYDAERVAIAAHYLGISGFPKVTEESILKWRFALKPTRVPILTFDFHRLARAYVPSTAQEFFRLRLSHPFLGRMPGSQKEEAELIGKTICALLAHNDGIKIRKWSEAENRLKSKAVEAEDKLGSPWPNVLARSANRITHISKATGPRALAKVLDALSLLHVGKIQFVSNPSPSVSSHKLLI